MLLGNETGFFGNITKRYYIEFQVLFVKFCKDSAKPALRGQGGQKENINSETKSDFLVNTRAQLALNPLHLMEEELIFKVTFFGKRKKTPIVGCLTEK